MGRSRGQRGARGRRALIGAAAIAAAQLAVGALAPACGDGEGDTTTGKRVTHATRITAGAEASGAFTGASGWSITLSRAYLSVGALYYFDGAPLTARLDPGRGRRRRPAGGGLFDQLARWAVPEAAAHPGHYAPGEAKGEMTAATSVDLAVGPATLEASDAVSGVYRSARLVFGAQPAGPLAGELGASVVVVEGTAEKGGEERPFRVEAVVADVLDSEGDPAVEGCVFEEADVQEDGGVTVTVKPSVWFDQVDFADVPASPDGQPVLIAPGSTAHRAFARGLKKGTAYVFSYAPGQAEETP